MRIGLSGPVFRIGATLIAFGFAIHGFGLAYHDLRGHAGPIGPNAFRALQLIVGKFPQDLEDAPLPLSLEIARWALPLLTFWTTIALAWRQVRNPILLRMVTRGGEHLIVAGGAGLAGRTAAAERDAKRPVLLWSDEGASDWAMALGDRGVPAAPMSGEKNGVAALGIGKARGALLVCDDQTRNMALAAIVVEQARETRPAGDPLPVIARIDDLELRRSVEDRHARMGDRRAARLRVISLPDIAARSLFVDQPLDRFRRIGDPDRLMLFLGFTPAIERLLVRHAAGGHHRDGRPPRFLVCDPQAEVQEQAFRARRPGAAQFAISFRTAPVDQPSLVAGQLAAMLDAGDAPSAIVVDLEDEARSLAVAYAIEGLYADRDLPSPPVHVRTAPSTEDQLGYALFPFGGEAALADPELLLQDRHDRLARAIHDNYLEGRLTDGEKIGARVTVQEWEDLPESFRDDNRLVADCYRLKLRDIGARLVADDDARGFRLEDEELEELSRAEHERWMGARLIEGWTRGPRDDAAKKHPDIMPYDELSERIRDLDREQIRMMTRLLPGSGQAPRRLLPIRVKAGAGSATIDTLIDRIGQLFPDRFLVLIGPFDDPTVRAALTAASAQGIAVQWLLTRSPLPVIEDMAHEERAATRSALRRADTIFAINAIRPHDEWLAAHAPRVMTVAADGRVAASWLT